MKKSIKKFELKSIKNVTPLENAKAIKGGTNIVPIRAPRYKGDIEIIRYNTYVKILIF